jgi:hypothetical protein
MARLEGKNVHLCLSTVIYRPRYLHPLRRGRSGDTTDIAENPPAPKRPDRGSGGDSRHAQRGHDPEGGEGRFRPLSTPGANRHRRTTRGIGGHIHVNSHRSERDWEPSHGCRVMDQQMMKQARQCDGNYPHAGADRVGSRADRVVGLGMMGGGGYAYHASACTGLTK